MPTDPEPFDLPPLATPDDVAAAEARADEKIADVIAQAGVLAERVDELAARLDEQPPPTPGPATTTTHGVALSSFEGSDDDKFAAYAKGARDAGSGFHGWPLILDQSRTYTVTKQLEVSHGFSILGSPLAVDQARASMPIPHRVNIRTGEADWLTLPAVDRLYGLRISGVSFDASGSGRVFQPGAAVIWTSVFRDISYQNGPGFMGSSATKQNVDATTFGGWWNLNNITDTALHLGGADCAISPERMLVDSPEALLDARGVLLRFGSLSKSPVSNLYVTAQGHAAMQITGSNQYASYADCVIEGRNAGVPCKGALIRSSGQFVQLRSSTVQFGMAKPADTGRDDQGLIHVTDGRFEAIDLHTRRANGVSQDVPFLYATGANTKVYVRNIVQEDGGKPIVRLANGAQLVGADDSITVIQ